MKNKDMIALLEERIEALEEAAARPVEVGYVVELRDPPPISKPIDLNDIWALTTEQYSAYIEQNDVYSVGGYL